MGKKGQDGQTGLGRTRTGILLGVLVFALTFATNFDGAFVLDDSVNITENPAVTQFDPGSLGSWKRAAFDSPARLRPIPNLTFAWQWYLSGGSRGAFHAFSDLLHALAAVVLFLLLLEFLALHGNRLKEGLSEKEKTLLAGTGALLWALHPVQTSAVTYLVQRMAVMSGLFQFVAFWLYLRGRRTGQGRDYALAAVAYLAALFSKENAATLPVILLLYEWLLGPSEEKNTRIKRVGLVLIACVPPVIMAVGYAALAPEKHFGAATLPGRDFTLLERLLSAPRMYLRYVGLLAFPIHQALDYGLAASKSLTDPWTTLPSWLLVLSLLGVALWKRRQHPVLVFCLFAFFAALGPETTFLNLELFYEHRLYVASAALLPLVPLGVWCLRERERIPARGFQVIVAALLLACAVLAGVRNREWKSALGLAQLNVERYPNNTRALTILGVLYSNEGDLNAAIEVQKRAISLHPGYAAAHFNLADALLSQGKPEEASLELEKAVTLDPIFDRTEYSVEIRVSPRIVKGFVRAGQIWQRQGDLERAIASYERATSLGGGYADPFIALGSALTLAGKPTRAISTLRQAITLDPSYGLAHFELARALVGTGDSRGAAYHKGEACRYG